MKTTLLVLLLLLSACHHAPSSGSKSGKVKGESFPDSSIELSKWVRKNVADYWQFEREHNSMGDFAKSEGIVVGDTHLANFGPIPVRSLSGEQVMRYLDIDFDDAGRAPFAYDFLRLVITTKATKKEVKIKELVASYLKGLTGGQAVEPPADIKDDLSLTAADYEKRMSDDMQTKIGGGRFVMKPGKIDPYSGRLTLAQASALLPAYHVLDLASRPTDSGDTRIWIYATDSSGLNHIFELKQYEPTRLSAWSPQADRKTWSEEIRAVLWPQVGRGEYELIDVEGLGSFWLRDKKLSLIDVPYSNQDKKAVKYVHDLAMYDAYILGQLHGTQSSAADYVAMLRNPVVQGAFQGHVKLAAKEYLLSVAHRAF